MELIILGILLTVHKEKLRKESKSMLVVGWILVVAQGIVSIARILTIEW